MFCKYCGKEIDDNAIYCKYCGKNVRDGSGSENRSDAGNAKTPYRQRQLERMQEEDSRRFDKVLAQNFAVEPERGVLMATSFHSVKRFASSILLLIVCVFFLVISFIVLVSYRPPWAVYVISWILVAAALIYFIICTLRITRSVFAVTEDQLLINTWMPSQKLTIPLDQIDRVNIDIVPFHRNEYGNLHLSVNGQTYDFLQIYQPNEFRDALMSQINKTKP